MMHWGSSLLTGYGARVVFRQCLVFDKLVEDGRSERTRSPDRCDGHLFFCCVCDGRHDFEMSPADLPARVL